MSYASSGLAPSANEFVPGQYFGRDAPNSKYPQDSELNSSANEWVPGAAISASQSSAGLNNMQDISYALPDSTYQQEQAATNEQMVEVYWNGTTIFVPESMTYMGEDGNLVYLGGDGEGTPATGAGAIDGKIVKLFSMCWLWGCGFLHPVPP